MIIENKLQEENKKNSKSNRNEGKEWEQIYHYQIVLFEEFFLRSIFHFIKSFWTGVDTAILGNQTKTRQAI